MDPRFDNLFSRPENQIFSVVFFPDRIYHAEYFNATTSARYRYYVDQVRDKIDIIALTGSVYLDGQMLAKVLRIEYRAGRLLEQVRERSRLLAPRLRVKLRVTWRPLPPDLPAPIAVDKTEDLLYCLGRLWPRVTAEQISSYISLKAIMVNNEIAKEPNYPLKPGDLITLRYELLSQTVDDESNLIMHFDQWINGYQVEIWSTLETPPSTNHDPSVLAQIGYRGSITSDRNLVPALSASARIERIEASFLEYEREYPLSELVNDPQIDDFYSRTIQSPNSPEPSSAKNTVTLANYQLDFQRAWVLDSSTITPVRYNNALIEERADGIRNPDFHAYNIIDMRWILQQVLGSSLVYFHEVTIPPGSIEGTHQHIGSEELYYVIEGEGTVYIGVDDDPGLVSAPLVESFVFGFGPRKLRQVNVRPGSVIFTKSGGIHGIRNPNLVPLRFVAFGYHTR